VLLVVLQNLGISLFDVSVFLNDCVALFVGFFDDLCLVSVFRQCREFVIHILALQVVFCLRLVEPFPSDEIHCVPEVFVLFVIRKEVFNLAILLMREDGQ